MKHLFFVLLVAMTLFSCNSSKEKTIENLKKSIEGEASAKAKYTAFADQAAKDSLYNVEALFRAIAIAENEHIKCFQASLVELGENEYKPQIAESEVKSTKENIEAALSGETTEFSIMYPTYANEAVKEGQKDVALIFNRVLDAEIVHAKILGETLALLVNKEEIPAAYFVCPTCGNIYVNVTDEICNMCGAPKDTFTAVHATMPLVPLGPAIPAM